MTRRVLRAPSATVAIVVGGALAVFLLGDAVLRAGWDAALLLAPWILLILWAVYVTMYVSHIATDASGVTVQNMLRVNRVPWARVADVDLRWQVVFDLDDGTQVTAFGGPLAGRGRRPGRRPAVGEARREPPATRDLELLREAWDAARDQASDAPVSRRWDVPALAALGVLVVWAVVAVIITGGPA